MNAVTEIIIHHYPASPVSEKIRTGMGLKQLAWRSVEQNRLPDRPELFAMTGGYRRIPVMQIGADIYCDTQCILRELERRVPTPAFFPNNGAGLPFALSRWSDGAMFELAFRVAFAPVADKLPAALIADRTRLYLGEQGDLKNEAADLPHTLAQLRPQLGWLEACLAGGQHFMLGGAGHVRLARLVPSLVRARTLCSSTRIYGRIPAAQCLGTTHASDRPRQINTHDTG